MRVHVSLLLLAASCLAQAQVVIDAPIGGWKHSGGESSQHMQDVHYPASRVNAGGRRVRDDGSVAGASIRGRILGAVKSEAKDEDKKTRRQPNLLVVNGVSMPLSSGDDGSFARPYSFPPGANSLEVRSANRKHVRRVNFYDANANRQRVGLRVVLGWDTDMTDLDLHVVSPDGAHVFYGNRVGPNGGALDVDVTDGYGPEIYAIPSPPKGLWHIYVNYYGSGENKDELTIAQVTLVMHEGTPDEKREMFRVPMRRAGDLTLIKSFLLQ